MIPNEFTIRTADSDPSMCGKVGEEDEDMIDLRDDDCAMDLWDDCCVSDGMSCKKK